MKNWPRPRTGISALRPGAAKSRGVWYNPVVKSLPTTKESSAALSGSLQPKVAGIRVFLAYLATALGCSGAVMSGDDFNANTEASVSVLQQWYNTNGLWNTTGW